MHGFNKHKTTAEDDASNNIVDPEQQPSMPAPAQLEPAFRPLDFVHLRLHFRAITAIQLPAFSGSVWRGVFGTALKKEVCVTNTPHCKDCTLYHSCLHSEIFEAPVPPDAKKMRLYPSAPHPYVIRPASNQQQNMQPGDTSWLDLLIFGRSIRHLNTVTNAVIAAGGIGIGKPRGRFAIERVEQHTASSATPMVFYTPDDGYRGVNLTTPLHAIPDAPESITVELQTPLRLRIDKKNMTAGNFSAKAFCSTLLRRYSMLCYFHGGFEPAVNFRQLVAAGSELNVSNQSLRWVDQKRYSSRQMGEIPIGGLTGSVDFSGPALKPLWPLLWLGQTLHLGKAAVMGLGQYQLHAASLPSGK